MPEETPYEKLVKANDEYHEAVDAILENDLDVTLKAKFAVEVNQVFHYMKQANNVIKEHYEPEEE